MSVSGSSSYATLLPVARVAVFSGHEETRAAVSALAADWRFARVTFDIQTGDLTRAIQLYAQGASPNVIIIDTDVIDSSFTALLEQLASTCTEGTDAVVVGPVNDVAMYRYLINMGVGDYLVRPLQSSVIADVIARLILAQLGASGSQLIATIGGKGGVGTSTIAGLVGYGLSEHGGHKTVLLDMAFGKSYLPVAFGLEPVATFSELARAAATNDPNAMQRMLLKAGKNLFVLGTGNDRYLDDGIPAEQIDYILDRILSVYPYVVIDLSSAPATMQRLVLARAQKIILVSTPTLPSLRLTRALINDIKDLKGGNTELLDFVLNMTDQNQGAEVKRSDIEAALQHKVNMMIPYDPKLIMTAEAKTKILGTVKGISKIIDDLIIKLHLGQSGGRSGTDPSKSGGGLLKSLIHKAGA